jgi:hypothetical protein
VEHRPVSRWLQVNYFICSFFGCITLADRAAIAHIRAQGISNFEGASGYAWVLELPLWFGLFVLIAGLCFLPLRRHRPALIIASLVFALLAVPFLDSIAIGIFEGDFAAGPFGRL